VYKFIKYQDAENKYDKHGLTMEIAANATLDELVELFEQFLRASGFTSEGSLTFVDETAEGAQ
jgi:hypothetical protein